MGVLVPAGATGGLVRETGAAGEGVPVEDAGVTGGVVGRGSVRLKGRAGFALALSLGGVRLIRV